MFIVQIKERQDEKFRHADRQALHYQEENEKITHDLNQTRVQNSFFDCSIDYIIDN